MHQLVDKQVIKQIPSNLIMPRRELYRKGSNAELMSCIAARSKYKLKRSEYFTLSTRDFRVQG